MPLSHLLLTLAVVFVWGTNFVVIKWALAELPPFLFATLRFAASSLPFLLIIPRPAVPLYKLATFGMLLGAGQFGLMFYAINADISPGLASLVVQMQVFFTIGLAMVVSGERLRRLQLVALALAVTGIAVIAGNLDGHVTALGLALVLLAALSWALANQVVRSVGKVDALGFVVWSSLFALPPLVSLSVVFDNPEFALRGLQEASWRAWSAVAWQALGNTLFGYSAWNWLLARYPAATLTPLALLVPVFGLTASALALGEALPGWKLGAAALVISALALNTAASRSRPA